MAGPLPLEEHHAHGKMSTSTTTGQFQPMLLSGNQQPVEPVVKPSLHPWQQDTDPSSDAGLLDTSPPHGERDIRLLANNPVSELLTLPDSTEVGACTGEAPTAS